MMKKRGYFAESFAALFLRLKGYHILERNFNFYGGEVDIIAQKGWGQKKIIIFVEVKYRRDKRNLDSALKPAQWQRIAKAATAYIARRPPLQKYAWRFDEIWVWQSRFVYLPILLLRHHKNMWHY